MRLVIVILFILMNATCMHAQEYDYVNKLNRHVSIVIKDEFHGMTYDNKLVLPVIYHGIDEMYNGFFIYRDSLSGFTDHTGKIIIPVGNYSIEPIDDRFIQVYQNGNESALYDYQGKIIIPFGVQEINVLEKSIIVFKGQQGLFALDGSTIIPFGDHEISALDELGEVVAVTKDGKTRVRVNEDMKILDGYVPVNSELFAKTTEVSISEYFSFVAHQKMNSFLTTPENYEEIPFSTLFPDTNFVEQKLRSVYRNLMHEMAKEEGYSSIMTSIGYGKFHKEIELPFVKNKEDMSMLNFPVTGISKEQAENYARWLTMLSVEELNNNDYGYSALYRLPSEKEWKDLAESGLNEKMRQYHVLDSLNAEKCMLFIYNNLPKCKGYENYVKASLGGGTVPVKSMNPDWNGAYQFFGNVAEMVQEKGISKGGSYFHGAKNAVTTEKINYSGPQPWLGFRVVAELGMY